MRAGSHIDDIVDLDRYPIADLFSPIARAVVEKGRAALNHNGLFTLPGFIRPSAVLAMQAEAAALTPEGHYHERYRDGVHKGELTNAPRPSRVSLTCVGLDQMAVQSPMRRLFFWDGLTDFIAMVLGRSAYHRTEDPIVSCMMTALGIGDELGWHFDPNDGVVSLAVQAASAGGEFEFAPFVKRDVDGDDTEIEAVMTGRYDQLVKETYAAGTLSLFNGSRSLHRVAPVEAGPDRVMLLFSYDDEPGQRFGDPLRQHFFGRTEPLNVL